MNRHLLRVNADAVPPAFATRPADGMALDDRIRPW
jgi:hypothetical protein